jgi:hypothetical protein
LDFSLDVFAANRSTAATNVARILSGTFGRTKLKPKPISTSRIAKPDSAAETESTRRRIALKSKENLVQKLNNKFKEKSNKRNVGSF